jgi:DNA-binding NtrC family response regulator
MHKRILVVDDDAMVLFVLHDTLKRLGEGFEIVTTASGVEALDQVKKMPFDLVITDVSMPDMGGVELTEAIKVLNLGMAVIWITAYGSNSVYADAVRLGVHCCRDKPVEVDDLLAIAREALEPVDGQNPAKWND